MVRELLVRVSSKFLGIGRYQTSIRSQVLRWSHTYSYVVNEAEGALAPQDSETRRNMSVSPTSDLSIEEGRKVIQSTLSPLITINFQALRRFR